MYDEDWKRHRKHLFIFTCVGGLLFRLSLTSRKATEYYYFRDTMGLENADLFFGFSGSSFAAGGVINLIVGSYYYDLTHNYRQLFIFSNVCNILGNLSYLLYYSPYLVLLGNFLSGIGGARPGESAEIYQSYEADELTPVISIMSSFALLGALLAPFSVFVYNLVDIKVGGWILDVNNVGSLVTGSLYVIYFLAGLFYIRNISKQYNLKKESFKNQNTEMLGKQHESNKEEIQPLHLDEDGNEISLKERYVTILQQIFQHRQIIFLYLLMFYKSYARQIVTMLRPVITAEYMNWKQTDMATLTLIVIITAGLPTMFVLVRFSRKLGDLFFLICGTVFMLFALFSIAMFPFPWTNVAHEIIIYITMISIAITHAIFQIVIRSMLAKLVPHEIQGITEGVRQSLFEFSVLLGGLSLKLFTAYTTAAIALLLLTGFIVLIWLLMNFEEYNNIEVLKLQ